MLSKVTYWLAGIFLVTSLVIEFSIVAQNRSVLDKGLSSAPRFRSCPCARRSGDSQKVRIDGGRRLWHSLISALPAW